MFPLRLVGLLLRWGLAIRFAGWVSFWCILDLCGVACLLVCATVCFCVCLFCVLMVIRCFGVRWSRCLDVLGVWLSL